MQLLHMSERLKKGDNFPLSAKIKELISAMDNKITDVNELDDEEKEEKRENLFKI